MRSGLAGEGLDLERPVIEQLEQHHSVATVVHRIRVDKRHLVVEDGIGHSRRERRFHKATSDLKRLVILGTTGYISLEAVRWLADARIPMAQVDPEGRLLVASQPMGSDRAALRRAQAWALTNDVGLDVVRYLLDRKLEGQGHIAAELGGDRTEINSARYQLEVVDTLNELLWLEASAAIYCRPMGEIMVKGVAHKLRTYEAVGSRDELSQSGVPVEASVTGFNLALDPMAISADDAEPVKTALKAALAALDGRADEQAPS